MEIIKERDAALLGYNECRATIEDARIALKAHAHEGLLLAALRIQEELVSERALADRLHGALDALDYNLAFAENTAHGSLGEKITAMRSIALPSIEAWKEARSECR